MNVDEERLEEYYDIFDGIWERWEKIEDVIWKRYPELAHKIVIETFMEATGCAENGDFETAYKLLDQAKKLIEEAKKKYTAGALENSSR